MQSKTWSRLGKSICACIIGAAAGSISFQAFLIFYNIFRDISAITEGIDYFISGSGVLIFAIVFVVILIPLCAIGLPVQYILQKFSLTGWLYHSLPATAAAVIFSIFYTWLSALVPLCGAVGFITGTVAWLIRRPDLDDKPQIQPPNPL